MTIFALTSASSRGSGKRQVDTKFRLSKSKGRSMSAMVVIGDDGQCLIEMRANSHEIFGRFSAGISLEFINAAGESIYAMQTPSISTTNIVGICLRGKLSHTFNVDPELVKQTEKLRLTSGKES